MDTAIIRTEIIGTLTELMKTFSIVDEEQVDVIPFEGSWTAGQLAKHVDLSASGFTQVINGPARDTERKPDEMVDKIKTDFLNFNVKMKSPPAIVPEYKKYDKEKLLHSFEEIKSAINHAIDTLDLSKTCLAFELPGYGFLTRLEAIYFVVYHTQRHIYQLQKIISALESPKKIHKTS